LWKPTAGEGRRTPQPVRKRVIRSGELQQAVSLYFSFAVRVSDQAGRITGTEMKKMKTFVLITLAVCVTIHLFVVWMLW